MSIELPEAKILATQMNKELKSKKITSYQLQDCERLQKTGLLDKDTKSFNQLINGKITSVSSRGNTILVKLDNGSYLILAPEYGGQIFYHAKEDDTPVKFHLKVVFDDNTMLTVRLTSMGHFSAVKDRNLDHSYMYKRDFNPKILSPLEEAFTFECFSELLVESNRMLKPVLVGKNAIVVGLSNSSFQDIVFRARLHPKRKASNLKKDEMRALYDAINLVIRERIQLKGKSQFYDFYGKQGNYKPVMGPNMKQQTCRICKTPIEVLNFGGGRVYFCPKCQR
jgi:formamidopyrimidine-DNA glycosylase